MYELLTGYSDLSSKQTVRVDLAKLIKEIPSNKQNLNEYTFKQVDNIYDTTAKCYYCSNSHGEKDDPKESLNNSYNRFKTRLSIDFETKPASLLNELKFNSFKELKILSLKSIDLSKYDIGKLFAGMDRLESLELMDNNRTIIPEDIFNLKSLKILRISGNKIDQIFKAKNGSVEKLDTIQILELDNLKLNETKERLKISKEALKIKFSNMRFNGLPLKLDESKDTLKDLELSGVKWVNFDSYMIGSNFILTKDNLIKELKFVFNRDDITKLFATFDEDNNGYLNYSEANKLNAFIFKKFPRLGSNKDTCDLLGGIPAEIFELKYLTSLNLSYQAITIIPDSIGKLENLVSLILNDCILLETISDKLSTLKLLKILNINNCYSLKTPPPEICKRGLDSIMSYLRRLSTGSVECKRTKLILVNT